jgi:tetratricopeptide (TPR) repeat protein
MTNAEQLASFTALAMSYAKAGRFQAGLDKLAELSDVDSTDTEALYVKAVCLRKLNRYSETIETLQQVLAQEPGYVRAHQEMGHALLSEGKLEPAIKAYERAVELDSALIASWRALLKLYTRFSDQKGVTNARHEILQLEQLAPALQAVKSNLNRDNLEMADLICREYMQHNKQDIEGMRLLAEIASRAKILDDAEFILESAVAFSPKHIGARFDYSNMLMKRQKFGAAHDIAKQLLTEDPKNIQFKSLLAATSAGVGENHIAIKYFHQLIDAKHHLEHAYLLLGHAQKTVGNLPAAIQAYQNLYTHKPDFGDAFWSLANTKAYTFSEQEVAHMEDYRKRESTSDIDKVHFHFALGKAYEDLKDYNAAFSAYHAGNTLNGELTKYQAPEIQKRVERQKVSCNKELFNRLEGAGDPSPDPIFIVGLPRAGSTLLEQILASHSQVDGTLELSNILSLSRRLRGREPSKDGDEPDYPRILTELDRSYLPRFGKQYIDDTQVFRQGGAYFIDKMPNNFLHIGLIKLILPNAKVIDARRHPMACCFSGFKQLFAEGQEFTYGLAEVGDYYKHYVDMMDHWDEVLPGFVLRVQHEDVVEDLESQVHRILQFCGLPFEQSCLEFYKTERNVRTPSSEQVRKPIYKTGLEQWRNFETHLNPLIEALGPEVLKRYPIKSKA